MDDGRDRCRHTVTDASGGGFCCWRPTWRYHDDCVWHAGTADKSADALADARGDRPERLDGARLVGADLAGADLAGCSLADAVLKNADLAGADLRSADLSHADLSGANLRDADLHAATLADADLAGADAGDATLSNVAGPRVDFADADLSDANLAGSDYAAASFRDATLAGATLGATHLSDADFGDADLSGADLSEARLDRAVLDGVQVDQATVLDVGSVYERAATASLDPAEVWSAAARTYHALRSVAGENGLTGEEREFYLLERRARRREAWARGDYLAAAGSWLSWIATGHGVSVVRVVSNMVTVLLVSTVGYVFLNVGSHDLSLDRVVDGSVPVDRLFAAFWESFYFSVVTFTTVGYGDIHPVSARAQQLAVVEAFFGTVLMVLLGLVLTNRESP